MKIETVIERCNKVYALAEELLTTLETLKVDAKNLMNAIEYLPGEEGDIEEGRKEDE